MYSITLFSAITITIRVLYMWLTSPSGTIFKMKKRPTPPACLNNPEFGEHKYIQLKVRTFYLFIKF